MGFFSLPLYLYWLWSSTRLLSYGYQGSFPGRNAARAWSWPLVSI